MINSKPNWTVVGTGSQLEKKLGNGFEFNGPGIYLTIIDTILAFNDERNPECFWHQKYKQDEIFHLWIYNVPYSSTILFPLNAGVPCRQDDR